MENADAVYLYNRILLTYKKEWSNVIGRNMDRPGDYNTKWYTRKRQILYDITYMWNLENDTDELI